MSVLAGEAHLFASAFSYVQKLRPYSLSVFPEERISLSYMLLLSGEGERGSFSNRVM